MAGFVAEAAAKSVVLWVRDPPPQVDERMKVIFDDGAEAEVQSRHGHRRSSAGFRRGRVEVGAAAQ